MAPTTSTKLAASGNAPTQRTDIEGQANDLAAAAVTLLQLTLATLIVWQFQLESSAFLRVLLIACGGFAIHSLLPHRWRLTFFVLLSLISILAALGVRDGLWLIGAGLSLILACHLPISMAGRVVVLLALGSLHALARAGLVPVPWTAAVWPILGSMFMFRTALYLYGLQHDALPPTWTRSLAYFFMLPNAAYPLFPVVDYSSFGRSYYDTEARLIYQRGMQWIARGLLHLLLYRLVYLYMTIPASEIADAGDLMRSLLSTFLLYLRVSGQFHLVVGMLHLFGFHLPETHKLYYLASSFTDFWRRINIYWKDFMMKLVYYPSFFRLRRFGDRFALVVATAIVFFTTWLLHSYQWFWLQGGFPLTPQDVLFWGLLCLLVIGATMREMKRGRKRTLAATRRFDARRALRVTGMFCTLTVLWSLWSAESVADWLWHWSALARIDGRDTVMLMAFLAGFFLIAGRNWDAPVMGAQDAANTHRRLVFRTTALLAFLLLLSQPAAYESAGPRAAGILGSLRTNSLNAQDQQQQFLGYYEKLDNEGRLVDVGKSGTQPPRDSTWRRFASTQAGRQRKDFLVHEIVPSKRIRFKGAVLTTNRWGMRDREYTLEKPDGVKRIAILGSSINMGEGVDDDEVFEAVLEQKLNELARSNNQQIEVLNFGVAGYSVLQQLNLLEERVLRFDPDIVIITLQNSEHLKRSLFSHLLHIFRRGVAVPYPDLAGIFERQGIRVGHGGNGLAVPYGPLRSAFETVGVRTVMPDTEVRDRLAPAIDEVMAWCLGRISQSVRGAHAVPVLISLDDVTAPPSAEVPYELVARSNGFVVINLLDLYEGMAPDSLRIAAWDDHPNARANRLIADRLAVELQKNDALFRLRLSPAAKDTTIARTE